MPWGPFDTHPAFRRVVADRGSNASVQIDPFTGDQLIIASRAPLVDLSSLTFDVRRSVIYVNGAEAEHAQAMNFAIAPLVRYGLRGPHERVGVFDCESSSS
jgi:hypothetical protein